MARRDKIKRGSPVGLIFTGIIGFVVGGAAMLALYIFTPDLLEQFDTELARFTGGDTDTPSDDHLLFEATQGRLTYRAHAQGIEPGSAIHDAIMASQPSIAASYGAQARQIGDADVWVEILFEKTASAGPYVSILRTDYIQVGNEDSLLQYAATLVNTEEGLGAAASDLFLNDAESEQALATLVCNALLDDLRATTSDATLNGTRLNCSQGGPLPFFGGPPLIFLPSTEPDKFGGVAMFVSAGRIAPIQMGEFILTIPQADLRDYVRPADQNLFAGEPDI